MKVISFLVQKGGCGKTTECSELISFLCQMRKKDGTPNKVLAIDFDSQNHIGKYISDGVEIYRENKFKRKTACHGVYEVMTGDYELKDCIQKIQIKPYLNKVNIYRALEPVRAKAAEERKNVKKENTSAKVIEKKLIAIENKKALDELKIKKTKYSEEVESPSFDLLIANDRFDEPSKVFSDENDTTLLQELLEYLKDSGNNYDYVLIDTHPGRTILQRMCMVASDMIIIPCEPEEGDRDGTEQTLADIRAYMKENKTKAKAYVLKVKVTGNGQAEEYNSDEIDQYPERYGTKLFRTQIRYSKTPKECRAARMTSGEYKPSSPFAIDNLNLTEEVIRELGE